MPSPFPANPMRRSPEIVPPARVLTSIPSRSLSFEEINTLLVIAHEVVIVLTTPIGGIAGWLFALKNVEVSIVILPVPFMRMLDEPATEKWQYWRVTAPVVVVILNPMFVPTL